MDRDPLAFPIQYIKGVGPRRAKFLHRLNIQTTGDALSYLPYRYEDRRLMKKICSLAYAQIETATGEVVSAEVISLPRSRYKVFELIISDGSGLLKGKWFNQPFMKRNFKTGQRVILSGTVKRNSYWGSGFEMDSPEYEILDDTRDDHIHTARIVPIYRTTAGMSVRMLRSVMHGVLAACTEHLADPLPEALRSHYHLPDLRESVQNVHFPSSQAVLEELNQGASDFRKRLSFDELLKLEIGIAILKKAEAREAGISFRPKGALVERLLDALPFQLTAAQERVFDEILDDMRRPYPMNRLVQGDVGCGKTIVALMAMLTAIECGYQAVLMAPTEILAEQHYMNIHRLVEPLSISPCLLTGSKKERPLDAIASGNIALVIGTHALIQEGVRFKKLGLVIIDEQHRFGVMQRALLRKKARNPDVLVMTATPIPRTLAMTVYGDLDYSIIDELPPQRSPVITKVFKDTEKDSIYLSIATEVDKGRQVYVVYPVIEESEQRDLKSALNGKAAFERLFPRFRTGLIHGKMKVTEREAVMTSFKKREIDILVSTTVIEVGVDVPHATLMLIIHAERFGLSQLHQLRGRVGRGDNQSYCLLLAYGTGSEDAQKRLSIMAETNDGFRIAEEDLKIRGPGEFLGTRQSGLPDMKIADIVRDAPLLDLARKEAFSIVSRDPQLDSMPLLKQAVERFWEGKTELFKTG